MIAFRLQNIQSIVDASFIFEKEHGLVQFIGNNSNGKSILGKVISTVVFQQLTSDEDRLPLIRDNEQHGSFSMQWNNKVLGVIFHTDINRCVYIYQEGDNEPIRRGVRQTDSISKMLRSMGFLIYGRNEVCLQICETYGAMPFINTHKLLNGEIVNACCTDISSENFIKNYNQTFKVAKKMFNAYRTDIDKCDAVIESTNYKNYNGLREIIIQLRLLYERGKNMPYIVLDELNPPTYLRTDLDCIDIINLYPPICLETVGLLNNLLNIVKDIQDVYLGKCPTCGRRLVDCR